MSDSVSSASKTIASQLTGTSSNVSSMFGSGDGSSCTTSNIKFFFWMLSVISIIFLSFSVLSNILVACSASEAPDEALTYVPMSQVSSGCRSGGCGKPHIENFSNDIMYNYQHTDSSNYQSIPLTAPDTEQKNPANLVFGEAHRFVTNQDGHIELRLEIYANLYVLDGNILNQTKDKVTHSYQAYLVDKNKKETNIGALKRDGDGMYKLKTIGNYASDKPNLVLDSTTLLIKYEIDGESTLLLVGKFA
jgi:hypothetical protein